MIIPLSPDKAVPCGLIMNEILSNTRKYAYHEDQAEFVDVRIAEKNGSITFDVRDYGPGLPPTVDPQNPSSLGLTLIRLLTETQLKGNIRFIQDDGVHMEIVF